MALFIIYCIDGELDNIKKISLKNCDLEMGFKWACLKGHFKIVQYLIELYKNDPTYKPINIHENNEVGFKWAYDNGHHNIVKYLMTLYKKHNYKPINNYLMAFKKIDKYVVCAIQKCVPHF